MPELYNVGNPINREERNNLNLTFRDILNRFSSIKLQFEQNNDEFTTLSNELNELIPLIQRFTNSQTNLQNQINQLVANGDSSPEAAQARVGYNNTVYTTLKQRLDAEITNALNTPPKSTTVQAQSGTDDMTYMTPLKVREAINYYGLTQRGSLPTGTNLNDIVESGIYNLNTTNYINRPNGSAQAVLFVIEGILGALGNSVQIIAGGNVTSSTYHFRTRNGPLGEWSGWEQINLTRSSTSQARAGTDDTTYMTPLKVNDVTGNISALQTVNKTNLVSAINEVFQGVDNGKDLIASAITDRGIATQNDATFQQMADNIKAMPGGVNFATGTLSSSSAMTFTKSDGSDISSATLTVSGLNFKPKYIHAIRTNTATLVKHITTYYSEIGNAQEVITQYQLANGSVNSESLTILNGIQAAYVNDSGFRIPVRESSVSYRWVAYG